MFPENPLQLYGTALETYRGAGQLTFSSNRSVNCEFVAGQLESGKTFLLCVTQNFIPEALLGLATPILFTGETNEGFTIEVDHFVSDTKYLPEMLASGTYLALRVGHLKVCRRASSSRRSLTFILTNLDGIHSAVSFQYSGFPFLLQPVDGCSANLERLEVLRGVLPTAQLRVVTRASIERVSDAVSELCYLLSIALGIKIQWITLTEATAAQSWLCKHHYSHITKRYGVLHIVDPRRSDVRTFLQLASDGRYARSQKAVNLTNAVIDTYLDAKSEGDFLQVRALKLVVAVEMFKAAYADKSETTSLILSSQEFDTLLPKLKSAVRDVIAGDSKTEQRKAVYANIRTINRVPFSRQLRELCAAVRLPTEDDEISRFVASRNKLVHEGHFYCERATDQEKAKIAPLPTVTDEWFWLLHFVDRLFLRAIDYEGKYIDWSIPSSPTVRELRPAV